MSWLAALAIGACLALGLYKIAGIIAFLMLLAELVQRRTALGARRAIASLIKLTPTRARLIKKDGSEELIEAHRLSAGQRIRLRPGDNVPADGIIRHGQTTVDEATITGESLPVDKGEGDQVFAGTMNHTGAVEVEVTRAGEDTTLGRVRHLILDAEKTKIPLMRIIDRYVQWYTPVVIMLVAIIYVFTREPERAITAILVCVPSAFILATPTAMVAALSCAARVGILVKNVSDLEAAGKLTAICFDKTGTLTTGQLAVTRMTPTEGLDAAEFLKLAASAERHSNHPVAKAVVAVAQEAEISLVEPDELSETAGKGVRAKWGGHEILVGRYEWLQENGVTVDTTHVPQLDQERGYSSLFVARDGAYIGWVGLEDKPRPDARQATEHLKELGIEHLTMFTGDRWSVARKVAGELGCTHVEAQCLPERKLELVSKLKSEGHLVAVVGDGINDAPALAAGDIGVAMGAAGSDIAISSATIALMSSDLERLPFLIKLSRKARKVVTQNIALGIVFIVVGLALASRGLIGPVTAALFQIVAAFIVVFNSARLVRFGEELQPFTGTRSTT